MPNYYNPYYPMQSNGYPTQPTQQQMQMPQVQAQAQAQMQQIQNGGFVSVRNEIEARNYPVAPGNSITFKDETAPYVYTKTMGFSQLDRPIFDKYRLVKENPVEPSESPQNSLLDGEPISTTIDSLKAEIRALQSEIDDIKRHMGGTDADISINKRNSRKEKEKDDDES